MRRVRAVLIIAVVWAFLWLPLGIAIGVLGSSGPRSDVVPPPFVFFPILLTAWGGFSGGVFAILLTLTERGRSLEALSLIRTSLWGALGCMTVPIVITLLDGFTRSWSLATDDWTPILITVAGSAVLGALCAGGTLAIVRRAPP